VTPSWLWLSAFVKYVHSNLDISPEGLLFIFQKPPSLNTAAGCNEGG
jgi:hypothetical protein